jgi:hypothetical protein
MFSKRLWFGPNSQIASMRGSATISVIEAYATVSPKSSDRANPAASPACLLLGLHIPRISTSRTATND